MRNRLIFIYVIATCSFSVCWRLSPGFGPPAVAPRIPRRNFPLSLEATNDLKPDPGGAEAQESIEEGWLMELTASNVEGVFDLIRPQLSADGGGITLCKIVDNEVFVEVGLRHAQLTGSCVGCPYRSTTLKDVIESNLVKFLKSPNGSPICVRVVQDE